MQSQRMFIKKFQLHSDNVQKTLTPEVTENSWLQKPNPLQSTRGSKLEKSNHMENKNHHLHLPKNKRRCFHLRLPKHVSVNDPINSGRKGNPTFAALGWNGVWVLRLLVPVIGIV